MPNSPRSQILGRVPSGLFILTVRHESFETGMLASWVMQAGFDPPSITVAVQKDRYVAEWLTLGEPFVINILSSHDKKMLKHFAHGFSPDEAAFEGLAIERTSGGVPILADTLGHLECAAPTGHVDSGDHRIFLAAVRDGRLASDDPPAVHVRKSGLRY